MRELFPSTVFEMLRVNIISMWRENARNSSYKIFQRTHTNTFSEQHTWDNSELIFSVIKTLPKSNSVILEVLSRFQGI